MIQDLECPKCEVTCYIDIGDINDLTMGDPEMVQCWNCKKVYNFQPGGEINLFGYKTLERLIEVGGVDNTYETPNEAAEGL